MIMIPDPRPTEIFDLSPDEIARIESDHGIGSIHDTVPPVDPGANGNGHPGSKDDLETRLLISAEKTVLGTLILINNDANLPVALAQLIRNSPEAFRDNRHKQISSIIKVLRDSGRPVYPQAVSERCEFEDANAYVSDMVKCAISLDLANKEAEPIWQAYRERRTSTVLTEAFDTVANNPALVRSVANTVRKALTQLEDEVVKDDLPEIQDAGAMLQFEPILPDLLIEGLLHQGSKLSLGGSSKAYKSWTLIDMGASLSTGAPFMGFKTTLCRVLYVNFEIDGRFMHQRTNMVLTSRLLFPETDYFDVWNLRGKSAPYSVIVPKIIKRAKSRGYGLIIIDPSYKLFDAGADENSAVDVANVMNAFDNISTQTGASVAYGAHFAKGNASAKEAIDRVSGSGVFARDPDTILTFTKHQEENCFTVEASLRNLQPLDPFVVRWNYPRFERAEELDPSKLKQAGGRPSQYSPDDLLKILKDANTPLKTGEWRKAALEEIGISKSQFFQLMTELSDSKEIFKDSKSRWIPAIRVAGD